MTSQDPPIMVPPLCERHLHDLIRRKLRLREDDTWRASTVIANVLLFQWVICDRRIVQRAESDMTMVSLVLAEIGCLACYDPDGYDRVVKLMRKGDGKGSHAAAVSNGRVTDPDWPIEAHAHGDV